MNLNDLLDRYPKGTIVSYDGENFPVLGIKDSSTLLIKYGFGSALKSAPSRVIYEGAPNREISVYNCKVVFKPRIKTNEPSPVEELISDRVHPLKTYTPKESTTITESYAGGGTRKANIGSHMHYDFNPLTEAIPKQGPVKLLRKNRLLKLNQDF